MKTDLAGLVIADVRREFQNQRQLAERAIAQLTPAALFRTLDDDANSVAILMKHIGGNLRSRWTDFLVSDGEKPDRDRDGEFVAAADTVETVTGIWESGWAALDATLRSLEPADALREVRIRGEPLPVVQALNRSLAHTAQHVGQIILLARHWQGDAWRTLSIPRGGSAEFSSRSRA